MNGLDDLLAAANPVDPADLTYGTREEALLRSIVAGPPRPSPAPYRWALLAGAAALALGAVLWQVLVPGRVPEQRYTTSGSAHAILLAAADRADRTPTKRFWHSEGEAGQLLHRHHDGHDYTLVATVGTEQWIPSDPVDGIAVGGYYGPARLRPLTAADAAAYRADGSPRPNENARAGIVVPDPQEGPALADDQIWEGDPARLPADPSGVRMTMLTWMRDHGDMPEHPDAWLFREATKLLDSPARIPSPAVRGALYRMLAGLPGVRDLGTVRDPLGRPTIGVSMRERTSAFGTVDWQLLLSPTGDFVMATRAVVVTPGVLNGDVPAGASQYFTVKRIAEWTNRPPKRRLPGARR
jgi:hypothetical protein